MLGCSFSYPGGGLFSFHDDAPQPNQNHCNRIEPAGCKHDEHGCKHWSSHLRLFQQANSCSLVQRVPPLHGEIDDGYVDNAYDRQHGSGPIGPSLVINRRLQRDESYIKKEQDQRRRNARVPCPPSSPGGLTPERSRNQRDQGELCARNGKR